MTTIEVPDADKFPPREEVEKGLVQLFAEEGMVAHGLEITNYGVPAEEDE
ncbi:MAG: hypothetical protein J6S50_05750 [Oscillospiraceae bacterium]|nr:hypothetical protein [Oscillospiraceae bacterium]